MKKVLSISLVTLLCLATFSANDFSKENNDLAVERGCKTIVIDGHKISYGVGCHPIDGPI